MTGHDRSDGGTAKENLADRAFSRLAVLVNTASDLGSEANRAANLTPGREAERVAIEVLRKQQRFINAVATQPKTRAAVLRVYPNPGTDDVVALVSYQGQQLEVSIPKDMVVKEGDQLTLSSTTLGVTGLVDGPCYLGPIAVVSRIISADLVEISLRGEKRTVLGGYQRETLTVGDRVVIDSGLVIVLDNLGKGTGEFQFSGNTDLSWGDIVGCAVAKQKLRNAIELPYKRPDIFSHYLKRPTSGVLLIGGPGCGKSMLLTASMAAHRTIHGKNALVLYIKGAELLRGIVGETEELIRQLFAIARAHFAQTGVRGLLVIDEAEALLAKRGSGRSSDVEKTNVPTFLGEMGGPEAAMNPILLLASNRPDMLDEAITRDERMDEVISITPPSKEDIPAFLSLYLKKVPLAAGLDEMASYAAEEFLSEHYVLASIRLTDGKVEHFTLSHIVNGAMLAGIVQRAIGFAMRRDEEGTKPGDPLGKVTKEDIAAGIADALEKNRHLAGPAILEFARGFRGNIADPEEVLKQVAG